MKNFEFNNKNYQVESFENARGNKIVMVSIEVKNFIENPFRSIFTTSLENVLDTEELIDTIEFETSFRKEIAREFAILIQENA